MGSMVDVMNRVGDAPAESEAKPTLAPDSEVTASEDGEASEASLGAEALLADAQELLDGIPDDLPDEPQENQADAQPAAEGFAAEQPPAPKALAEDAVEEAAKPAQADDGDPLAAVFGPAAKSVVPAVKLSDDTVKWDASKIDPAVAAFHAPGTAACEQYRSVRARLLSTNRSELHQVLAVTSSIPREGKTTSAMNLSMVMAEGGERNILLVDADFRRPSISAMIGGESLPGLAELLRGEAELADVLQPSPLPNLRILPAGRTPDKKYSELLGGAGLRKTFDAIRAAFDYAFVDTPPVTTVSDVSTLAPLCDGALLIVQMRRTPEPVVQQAVRTLQTNNVKILGCVLARYREKRARNYDSYYGYQNDR